MSDRIRETLVAKPEVLWDLLTDLKRNPPKILSRWQPSRSRSRFNVSRVNTNGYDVVEIHREIPDQGPWLLRPDKYKLSTTLQDALGALPEDLPFHELQERVDELFRIDGWVLLNPKHPDSSFHPWRESSQHASEWVRHWLSKGEDMAGVGPPCIEPREPDDEKDRYKTQWVIHLPDLEMITGKAWNVSMARGHVDDVLVRLGFNLAAPEAFDLVVMARNHKRWTAKWEADQKKKNSGMLKEKTLANGQVVLEDQNGDLWDWGPNGTVSLRDND